MTDPVPDPDRVPDRTADVLATATGVLDADPDRVAALLLEVREGVVGDGNAFLLEHDRAGSRIGAPAPERPGRYPTDFGYLVVEPDRRIVALEGSWWYRGEYQVGPGPGPGSARVTYRLVNVAATRKWMVKGILAQVRLDGRWPALRGDGLADVLDRIAAALGTRSRGVDPG